MMKKNKNTKDTYSSYTLHLRPFCGQNHYVIIQKSRSHQGTKRIKSNVCWCHIYLVHFINIISRFVGGRLRSTTSAWLWNLSPEMYDAVATAPWANSYFDVTWLSFTRLFPPAYLIFVCSNQCLLLYWLAPYIKYHHISSVAHITSSSLSDWQPEIVVSWVCKSRLLLIFSCSLSSSSVPIAWSAKLSASTYFDLPLCYRVDVFWIMNVPIMVCINYNFKIKFTFGVTITFWTSPMTSAFAEVTFVSIPFFHSFFIDKSCFAINLGLSINAT